MLNDENSDLRVAKSDRSPLDLWHLGPIHFSKEDGDVFGLNVLAAHAIGARGKGATVAIIDSGADVNHPNLKQAISGESCSFEPYDDALVSSKSDEIHNRYNAHGTALAGIVAGRKANQADGSGGAEITDAHKRFFGVAPEAELLIIRLFTNFQPEQFLAALDHAKAHADVILLARSLPQVRAARTGRTLGRQNDFDAGALDRKTLQDVKDRLEQVAQERPVVCAAGNGGFAQLAFPASLESTIAVGACNDRGWRSTYSQYGKGLDVVAPSSDAEMRTRDDNRRRVREGTDWSGKLGRERQSKELGGTTEGGLGRWGIVTTDNVGKFGYNDDDAEFPDFVIQIGRQQFGGTSASSAQIAGVVALMIGKNKNLAEDPLKVRSILRDSASLPNRRRDYTKEEAPASQPDEELGWGLVDAEKAVSLAAG